MNLFDKYGVIVEGMGPALDNITSLLDECALEIMRRYPDLSPQDLMYTAHHTLEMHFIVAAHERRYKEYVSNNL